MKTVITYGTFDLLHYGHIEIFRRAKDLAEGGKLIVGLSTDEFNAGKGKTSHMPYKERKEFVEAIRYVDKVIPEENWEQKKTDVKKHKVDIFVMGDDWKGKFDELKEQCQVVYLDRTPAISSTAIKKVIAELKELQEEAQGLL
jgi:glycerol-3-phosphate cytidylyltransferase